MDLSQEYSELFSSLKSLIRSSNALYSLDVDFVRNVNRDLASRSENTSKRLLGLINELIAKCAGTTNGSQGLRFEDPDSIFKRWRSIEQVFDLLADKIDKPPQKSPAGREKTGSPSDGSGAEPNVKEYMRLANNIPKPQLKFNNKVDNSLKPFKPLLTQKPFANYKSLSQSVQTQKADEDHANEWYDQPYMREILDSPFPEYVPVENNDLPDWDKTPLTFVDTPKKLFKMISKLEKAKEIAVDVEHHDYRSYLGLVCLLQISGLGEDYVIDALALRSELQALNKVFANPDIVKIFHGAKMDMMWLQRDLGVYVVSLFDTYFAARELEFPKLSLAYLLQKYADFQAQKKFQLADWRLRPLPQELIDYARADTHFLIHIYHMLRQQLSERGLTQAVLDASRKVAAYRYENPGWNEAEPAWIQFAIKYRLNGPLQRAILVKLMEWRDQMARKYDESTRYVMAPQFLANLCITKPSNAQEVLAASHNASPIVRQNAEKIAEMIQYVCANPETVDTTMPEPKVPKYVSHSKPVAITDLKISESPFLGPAQLPPQVLPQAAAPSAAPSAAAATVCLDIYKPTDMEQAQLYNEAAAQSREAAEALQREAAEKKEAEQLALQQKQREELQRRQEENQNRAPSSGKYLNVVDDNQEFELTSAIQKPSGGRKKLEDAPAFDFEAAQGVLKAAADHRQNSSYSQFGTTLGGPKGIRKSNSKFKKAKSFRK